MPITSRIVSRHSGEDIDLTLSGYVDSDEEDISEVIFDPADYPDCTTVRVMNVFRAVQNGVLVVLCWDTEDNPILPLEGYGSTDLVKFGSISNPRKPGWMGCIKLNASAKGVKGLGYFTICLELSKQRT